MKTREQVGDVFEVEFQDQPEPETFESKMYRNLSQVEIARFIELSRRRYFRNTAELEEAKALMVKAGCEF